MNKDSKLTRKESDYEYSKMMLDYINDKYKKDFQIVESFFPKEGFNSSMKVNTLIVKEKSSDMMVNVYATLGEPYKFYDNYAESLINYLSQDKIDNSKISEYATSKLYLYLNETDILNPNTKSENINKATMVINVVGKPSEAVLKDLFGVYEQLSNIGSKRIFMTVGFTDNNDIFVKYVNNFSYYGDKYWEDYDGKVYASIYISDIGLSYSDFAALCKESK